jgi:hypothetical protein
MGDSIMPSIIRATTTSGLQVAPDNSGSLQLQTNGTTTAVTIDTSQNVGIGTASPAVKLQIEGDVRLGGGKSITATTAGTYTAGSSGYLFSFNSDGNLYQDNYQGAFVWRGASFAESMRIDSSGNLLFNSGYGSVATAYGCRAWVNFNGTGTVAIRGSGNVSSITDTGVGQYTINFTNAMPDANYSTTMTCQDTGVPMLGTTTPVTTASVKMLVCVRGSTSTVDPVICCAAVIR